jgi:hypothetical protein
MLTNDDTQIDQPTSFLDGINTFNALPFTY